jgi:hypothetical protein
MTRAPNFPNFFLPRSTRSSTGHPLTLVGGPDFVFFEVCGFSVEILRLKGAARYRRLDVYLSRWNLLK